jgi:hypothetical protein
MKSDISKGSEPDMEVCTFIFEKFAVGVGTSKYWVSIYWASSSCSSVSEDVSGIG